MSRLPWHFRLGQVVFGYFRLGQVVFGYFRLGQVVFGYFRLGQVVFGVRQQAYTVYKRAALFLPDKCYEPYTHVMAIITCCISFALPPSCTLDVRLRGYTVFGKYQQRIDQQASCQVGGFLGSN